MRPTLFQLMSAAVLACAIASMCASSAFAAPAPCKQPADPIQLIPSLGYEVAGNGRLYFYTAPNEACADKKVFVIPHDRLIANQEFGAWTWVDYTAKNGDITSGWVSTERLKFIGTEGYTAPDRAAFFEKAAKAAQAGRLGSPWGH